MEKCNFCDRDAHYRAILPPPPHSTGETIYACTDHHMKVVQDCTSMGLLDPLTPLAIIEQIWHPPPPAPLRDPLTGDEAYELRLVNEQLKLALAKHGEVVAELQKHRLDVRDLTAQLGLKDRIIEDLYAQLARAQAEAREKNADTIPPGAE